MMNAKFGIGTLVRTYKFDKTVAKKHVLLSVC